MDTVTVGCKLPHGLKIDLPGIPNPVTLNGSNSARIIGGYGMTSGIPKDAFDLWMAQHEWLPAVRNESIFVVKDGDTKSARAIAKEHLAERTGFEAIDPAKSPAGLSAEDEKVLNRQRAENPDRNRQVDELNA